MWRRESFVDSVKCFLVLKQNTLMVKRKAVVSPWIISFSPFKQSFCSLIEKDLIEIYFSLSRARHARKLIKLACWIINKNKNKKNTNSKNIFLGNQFRDKWEDGKMEIGVLQNKNYYKRKIFKFVNLIRKKWRKSAACRAFQEEVQVTDVRIRFDLKSPTGLSQHKNDC